jgi:hypothetical protein
VARFLRFLQGTGAESANPTTFETALAGSDDIPKTLVDFM